MKKKEILQKHFSNKLSGEQIDKLLLLEDFYKEWNQKINLVSRKDIEFFFERHLLHSLSIASLFQFFKGQKVLDLGTGGGFPGIPLSICFPETEFMLVDSIQKKISVVEAIAKDLNLQNVSWKHSRVESLKPRNSFHTIMSRGVAPMEKQVQWTLLQLTRKKPVSGPYGLIMLKGGNLEEEIEDYKKSTRIYSIKNIFPGDWFAEKYVLHWMPAKR